jgi:hypothetical protein
VEGGALGAVSAVVEVIVGDGIVEDTCFSCDDTPCMAFIRDSKGWGSCNMQFFCRIRSRRSRTRERDPWNMIEGRCVVSWCLVF